MTIWSSDDEKRSFFIRKWYRDYLRHGIDSPAVMAGWLGYMQQNGVVATWVAIVESAEGVVRLAEDAAKDGLPDIVTALKAELDKVQAGGGPATPNVTALQNQITALSAHLGVGTA